MKKILTLASLLVLALGWSQSANALTIYFKPSTNWTQSNAIFKLNMKKGEDEWKMVDFTESSISGVYYAEYETDYTGGLQFLRGTINEGSWIQWNYSSLQTAVPTKETYYEYVGSDWDNWGPTLVSTYLPTKYYFMSGSGDTWNAVEEMPNTNGVYTYSFSGVDYANKRVAWAPGDAFSANGSLRSWDQVCKSKTEQNNDDWVLFQSFSYSSVDLGNQGSAWYVPASDNANYNDGEITITFNSSDKSATITCTHTATIGLAGYATYSNGEKFTVSGAEKVYVATGKSDNTVELTIMDASMVFGAKAGVLLKGSGNVTINSVEGTATAYSGTNYLVGSGNQKLEVTDPTNAYVFSWDGSTASSVGFYAASSAGTIGAHKAYLKAPAGNSRFLAFSFSDDATGISELNAAQTDGAIYNLQGVRQSELRKGLNIVGGKKVMVK